ncbi:cancer/testis antigen family 47 member C1-like [Delphinus delphis]|uniref:cancer/testis antigen family 47 member C1-like n=1 Tax=Delphinus delphis TaxID=9728 RepID=UPI0028C478B9|nr:cancer/testis antigen family 47 member C1-like [Delphinus delphis]
MDGFEGATALLASLGFSRALDGEDGGQEAAQATVEEDWDVGMVEEEDEDEEEFELDIEDQEEDEYQSGEGDKTEEEVEEDKETEEEDENGQEGVGVVAGHGAPAAQFQSLLRDVVHCLLQRSHYNDRVLVGPHAGHAVVRRCSWEPRDTGERGDHMLEGECQAEGNPPWEPREPAEGAASQKAEEPAAAAAEAEFWAGEVLADASKSWEAGACGPDDGAEAGEGRPRPQALAAPAGASASKAGLAHHWPLAVEAVGQSSQKPSGPEIINSTGCEIYWNDGKNLTVKTEAAEIVLDVATVYKLGYFFHEVLVPKSILFFTNEASDYQYENSDEEVQGTAGEEEDSNEEPEGPEKDPDPAEGSSREPRFNQLLITCYVYDPQSVESENADYGDREG